jgi:hypothetical protein
VIAGVLAYSASQTSGIVSVTLATLAGMLSAIALWSSLFMLAIGRLMRMIRRLRLE